MFLRVMSRRLSFLSSTFSDQSDLRSFGNAGLSERFRMLWPPMQPWRQAFGVEFAGRIVSTHMTNLQTRLLEEQEQTVFYHWYWLGAIPLLLFPDARGV